MSWIHIPLLALSMLAAAASALAAASSPTTRDLQVVVPVRTCASLTAVPLASVGGRGSHVTQAAESTTNGIAVCNVDAVLMPAVHVQLVLPVRSWAQRYLQVGCGGLCGRVSLEVGAADGCAPLGTGAFAIAATDMGHEDNGGEFGRDPQARADFAHRAQHVTALAAKQVIRAYYGQLPARSYFNGCSDGGREALVEAQRYPGDFDGIVAGAPVLNFQVQNGLYHAWQARSNTGADGKPVLLAARLPLLHRAVLAKCDALDGQADGLVSDPRACHFDPGVLQCREGVKEDCLSTAEVDVVRRLYNGPRDPGTGERLTIGGPQPGSELNWAGVFVPSDPAGRIFSEQVALGALRNLVFAHPPAPTFSLADLQFDAATFDRLRSRHPLFDATNPDLSAFARRGGKLILWHGWADPHVSPLDTIAYHEAVVATEGAARAADFERLYLLPGVSHCGGGEGPGAVDLLTPMLRWVEEGIAPAGIVAWRSQQPPTTFGQPSGAAGPPPGARPDPPPPAGPSELAIAPYITTGRSTPAWRGQDFFEGPRGRAR